MSLEYKIYGSDGLGGPIDYSTPIGTTSSLTFSPPALAPGSDWSFAVRARDTVSGLTEDNVDAIVRVVTDALGADITGRPNAPTGLAAVVAANGSVRVSWAYNPGGQGAAPTGFHVYRTTPTISYASPTATVPYVSGVPTYSTTLTGLTDGASYQVAVRAYNATAEEPNATVATVTARSSGPAAVEGLSAGAVA